MIDRIHRTLLPDAAWSGAVRDVQNWIGGSDFPPRDARYVPPAPDRLAGLLHDLAALLDRRDLPPVLQAGLAHAQFEAIHPDVDGNGSAGER